MERERIKFTDFNPDRYKHDELIENLEIIVDHHCSLSFSFKNCVFRLINNVVLQLNGNLESCVFLGSEKQIQNSDVFKLVLGGPPHNKTLIKNVTIEGYYGRIDINFANLIYITDNSQCLFLHLHKLNVINSDFNGSCHDLFIGDVKFTIDKKEKHYKYSGLSAILFFKPLSTWDKKIEHHAQCENITFDKIDINPFYLAIKCPDKSSIDLSNANFIDKWSQLRKSYSGLSLFIVFLLTTVFFLPLFVEYFILTSTADITDISILKNAETTPFWKILLFGRVSGFWGSVHMIVTLILFAYNITRIWLTISVARLREEEKLIADANFQMTALHPDKYKIHYRVHLVLRVILILVLFYSAFKFWEAINLEVVDLSTIKLKDILKNIPLQTK